MKSAELIINGMTCMHCVMGVKKELMKMENVKVNDVQIGSAKVEYDETKVTEKNFTDAIEEAGYQLKKIN